MISGSPNLLRVVIAILLFVVSSRPSDAASLEYMLLPGSTITPYYGATQTGPAEALTGTFTWKGPDLGHGFDATSLSFSSASFSLTLDTTSANDVETYIDPSSTRTYFDELVDTNGLLLSVGLLQSTFSAGSYQGTPSMPTFVSYSDLTYGPYGAGPFFGHIQFSAQLIPEPSTVLLAAIGTLAAAIRYRRVIR